MRRDITLCSPSSRDVDWAGWEAALILSKQRTSKHKVPPNDYDGKLPDEDSCLIPKKAKSAQDMDLDAENDCLLGMGHNFHVSRLPLTDSASQCSARPAEVCEKKLKIAEVVAAATRLVADSIRWRCLPHGILFRHRDKVWRSIMKSVMSVIDVDLINVEAGNKRVCEYRKLFSKLNSFVHVDKVSKEEAQICKNDFLFNEKFQSDAMNCIAGGNGSDIDAEDFVGLSEGDVADLISISIRPMVTESMVCAWIAGYLEEKAPKRLVEVALEEMETFVPLKEDREMQLAMELSCGRCDHVLDYLFVEACKGFMSEELIKGLDEELLGSNHTSEDVLSHLAQMLYDGFHELADYKSYMLRFSEKGVIFPLTHGAFGPFSKEAIGVVQIANHERRRRGGRFIGLRDILFGLSCAGYLKSFDDTGLPEMPEMPPYKFYRLAGELAMRSEAESVQIEHLVWAFLKIAEQHRQAEDVFNHIITSAITQGTRSGGPVIVFTGTYKEKGLLHDGKPICGFKALDTAIRKGLELPDIRMEHRATGGCPYFRPMDLCI